jgi:hypothetical protein
LAGAGRRYAVWLAEQELGEAGLVSWAARASAIAGRRVRWERARRLAASTCARGVGGSAVAKQGKSRARRTWARLAGLGRGGVDRGW